MRRVVGALCYMSLLALIGCACYCFYGVITPLTREGSIVVDNGRRIDYNMVQLLAQNGINGDDSRILKGYVTAVNPRMTSGGTFMNPTASVMDLLANVLFNNVHLASRLENNINWAMVADPNGKVVASYPPNIATGMGKIVDDSYPGWVAAFPSNRNISVFDVESIRGSDGKYLGSIAVSFKPYDMVAVIDPNDAGLLMSVRPVFITALICLLSFLILLPTWVAMDAAWRGMNPFAWAALVIITGLIGLAAYFTARLSQPKPCPNCGERISKKYIRCPSCGIDLSSKCSICGSAINPGWQFCPKCDGVPPAKPEPVPVPGYKPEHIALANAALTVTVLDNNGMPVPDCRVKISGISDSTGMTNNKGIFQAYALENGIYTVSLSKDGYADLQKDINVSTVTPAAIRLILTAHSGTIAGCVVSAENGTPVSSARVSLDSGRLDCAVFTDENGNYILEDIPAGPQVVCASAEQYLNRVQVAQVDPDQKVELDFALDSIAEQVELESTNVTK